MWKEGEEGSIITEKMDEPSEEIEVGPTSIDVTDEQPSTVEAPSAEQQEELQEQNKQIEQSQEKSRISKNKQKRRITSYLSNISKQVGKQGNQINKMMIMIQSLQKQKLARAKDPGVGQSQVQSVKQIQSQISQLQKQVARIPKDIQRIRTGYSTSTEAKTRTRSRKRTPSTTGIIAESKPKKSKSIKNNKLR
ncbi:MAG TPA: hypothetical protein VF220_06600 [Nitrososphaeraceae archaeon]